ncbi:MAG TPA: ATP-binding protein [Candidatus Angelobacter sp.]|jgi:signal transduction histidine kinase|nr:ATP-binding protein [Candidatus Angelobacter sp.]
MPAPRLKIKLVLAITSMVLAIVATISILYIAEVVHQRVQQTANDGEFIAWEIQSLVHNALDTDLSNSRIDLNDPKQIEAATEEILQTDSGLSSLFQSIIGYALTIQDAAVTNSSGRILLHTTENFIGQPARRREDISALVNGGTWQQFKLIYGHRREYDVHRSLVRNGVVLLEIRVGVQTLFLQNQLRPLVNRALIFSGIAIFASLVLAAGLSNFALRPLAVISHRLDLISSGQLESVEAPRRPADEYGAVSSKIDRLGRQMRDVKEVFSALKENLDQMMANLQDGVVLFTSDFKAVLVSASAERFIGIPRGEMLGRQPAEIFAPSSRLGEVILEAFATKTPISQREIAGENGRHLEISLDFIEERDERIGALLNLRDAESVHRIEDEIELSRRLAAIGRLTSGVAHEVKNPINAIVVHLEVMRQKLSDVDPATRRHMDVIGSEIKRLDRVVQTLVDFTRPVELRLSEMDLCKLVDDVTMLASLEAERHKVHIDRTVNEPLPVRIDVDLVKQALLNIVINGVQAMAEGGTLRVEARRENDSAVIIVQDEGPGIPADIRDKIFNLYFTTKSGGSGIGLAMAYRVVQLHNGSLEFDSIVGQGTTFYLRFPLWVDNSSEESRVISADSVQTA